jgi:uncharacterized protein YjbI with pentapeptide repeats
MQDGGLCIFHSPDLGKNLAELQARLGTRNASTEDPLRLDGAVFPSGVVFARMTFDKSVQFSGATFVGDVTLFEEVVFRGERTYFDQVKFTANKTIFAGALFASRFTNFYRAEFTGSRSTFEEARFHGESVDFNSARFEGESTSFSAVEFQNASTLFLGAAFNSASTSFSRAKFKSQRADFTWSRFRGARTSFMYARFEGRTRFVGARPGGVFLEGEVSFEAISFSDRGELRFDWADLSRARLFHAELTGVKFLDVNWNHSNGWDSWRCRSYDEERWWKDARSELALYEGSVFRRNAQFVSHLSRIYRNLKTYYETVGEYQLVGHFHYGLMEMRWQAKELETSRDQFGEDNPSGSYRFRGKVRKWLSWETVYRYSSGFGEDYAWSMIVLAILIGTAAVGFRLLGVPPTRPQERTLTGMLHSVLYSFQVASLEHVAFYPSPTSLRANCLRLIESLLVPTQFGFLVLALRNRFRR